MRLSIRSGSLDGLRTRGPGLDIRDGRSNGLREMDFGAQQERAQAQIGQRKDNIIVSAHETMVQQAMALSRKKIPERSTLRLRGRCMYQCLAHIRAGEFS